MRRYRSSGLEEDFNVLLISLVGHLAAHKLDSDFLDFVPNKKELFLFLCVKIQSLHFVFGFIRGKSWDG